MSVSLGRDLIASMNGQQLTVRRYAPGSYVAGKYVPGATSAPACLASVQPLSGNEIVRIPEGDRQRERKKLYAADLLQISNEAVMQKADEILGLEGRDWQVESVQKWTDYWKCIIVAIEPDEQTGGS